MAGPFEMVSGLRPRRAAFDLSYSKIFACDMGQLIPVMCEEMVPGDTFQVGNEAVLRLQPLVAPVLHELSMFVHYWFVPYRLLWDSWEDFITGGVAGDDASVLPRWDPTGSNGVGSLWDFFGFPTAVVPTGALPLQFPLNAYNMIYNTHYRDQTLQTEVALDQMEVLNRNWEKDYFTSALPWLTRGTPPALPIAGSASAVFEGNVPIWIMEAAGTYPRILSADSTTGDPGAISDIKKHGATAAGHTDDMLAASKTGLASTFHGEVKGLDDNTVDLSVASTFDVSDLRLVVQIQKWMERNARAGVRYPEFLMSHFGESPRDERLQRPEFISGTRQPVIISEVLQTSETGATTPQGNLAGHGISVARGYAGSYHATEYGLIIGIMSVMPRSGYSQGIDRQWLRRTRYDFYSPEFANLSEQAIETAEIFASGVSGENTAIFGYQGRYDEMRTKRNMVCGEMRSLFDYWHMGRQFASAPLLNDEFITCIPRKDIFAVQDEPGLIISFGNRIKAIRPMPIACNPGMLDHS